MLTELFPPKVGGSAVLFESVYSRLAGIDVAVLTDRTGTCDLDERVGPCRIYRRAIRTTTWGLCGRGALRQHAAVSREMRRIGVPPDAVIHCGRALPEGLTALWWRGRHGTKFVCWVHGEELAYAAASRELNVLTRLVHRRAGAVFANSCNTARALEAWGVPAGKVRIVYPGVDTNRFRPSVDCRAVRSRFAPGGEVLLLSVGRLQRRKGHDVTVAAVAALRAKIPHLRYVIVGDGEERPRLERLVQEHGVAEIVSFAGEVAPADLPRYYAAADIFVLPNRVEGGDFEGFGIVFLEAAASGLAAIGGASGGVPEAIADGETGLLVGGSDPGELAAAIYRLVAAPELRLTMGDAARRRAHRDFTWERAAATVAAAHCALASKRPARRSSTC